MIIPYQQLSAEALQGLLEEFITREGTDYGEQEVELDTKVAQLRQALAQREVVVVFDPRFETTTLMLRHEAEALADNG